MVGDGYICFDFVVTLTIGELELYRPLGLVGIDEKLGHFRFEPLILQCNPVLSSDHFRPHPATDGPFAPGYGDIFDLGVCNRGRYFLAVQFHHVPTPPIRCLMLYS